jgi:hypothetical protein
VLRPRIRANEGAPHSHRGLARRSTADQAEQKRDRCCHIGPAATPTLRLVASERISALSKASTRLPRRKVWAIPIIRLALTKLERRLFGDLDEQARHDGWQVTRLHHGFGRRYRDPRFDLLSACPDCAGGGSMDGQPCEPCRGTGRVTRARPRTPTPGGTGHA